VVGRKGLKKIRCFSNIRR